MLFFFLKKKNLQKRKKEKKMANYYDDQTELFLAIPNDTIHFKIVIIGQSGSGKTSILCRYTLDNFDITAPTIGVDFNEKFILQGPSTIKLQIWDTAGQEKHNAITSSFIRGAHGIILVYDITDISTFQKLTDWIDKINDQSKGCDIPPVILLVGNKTDLEENRAVSITEAQIFSKKYNLNYIEVSAKTNNHVDALFNFLIQSMMEIRADLNIDDLNESLKNTVYLKINPPLSSSSNSKKNYCCF